MPGRLKQLVVGTLLVCITAFAIPVAPVVASDHEFGAYIYETSCNNLGKDKIIEEVGDLEAKNEKSKVWTRLGQDAQFPSEFFAEDEGLDHVTLHDLTGSAHAIAVHADDSKNARVIACGDITGTTDNGTLLIQLNEVDNSGFEGRAFFAPKQNKDELQVTVGIWPAGEVAPLGTPAATPAS